VIGERDRLLSGVPRRSRSVRSRSPPARTRSRSCETRLLAVIRGRQRGETRDRDVRSASLYVSRI
jgi:hypothetical protein